MEGSGGVPGLVPEEELVPQGEESQEEKLEVVGPGGEAVMEVVVELFKDEQVRPQVPVPNLLQDEMVPILGESVDDLEGDEAQGVELEDRGEESGQPGMVGVVALRPDFSDLYEVPDGLLILLSHGGIVTAGFVMLRSKTDPLVEDGKLTGGHWRTRSGK